MANRLDIRGGVAEVLQPLVALPVEELLNVTQRFLLPSLDQALKETGLRFRLDGRDGCIRRPQGKGAHDHLHFVRVAGHQRALAIPLRWDGLLNCSNLLFQ